MLKRTEQIAWLVLLASFTLCITLTIGTPLSIRWYILNATHPLTIQLKPRSGTISVLKPSNDLPVLITEAVEIKPRDRIILKPNGDALLLFYLPDQTNEDAVPIVTVQLYNATDITVESAHTPSFKASSLPHYAQLNVTAGPNLRFTVNGNGRSTDVKVQTPYGIVEMGEGTYTLAVEEDQTTFSVSTGQGRIPEANSDEVLILTDFYRVSLNEYGVGEISAGERDILNNHNGDFETLIDFDTPAENDWQTYNKVGAVDENQGTTRQMTTSNDRRILTFTRVGQGFAETGITQELNRDIRGAQSVRVRARIRVDAQTLGVCGSYGSECPVMLRIYFADEDNNAREWLQGFYAVEGPDQPVCPSCEWQAVQIKVPLGIWYDYESPDLLPLLREKGINPIGIQSVNIYASGHTYSSAIDEIAILVGE